MQDQRRGLRRASIAAAVLALVEMPAAVQAGDLYSFHTPSKNIYCMAYPADDNSAAMTVECEIRSVTRRTLKVARPGDCDLEWGDRIAIGERGRPALTCHGDTLLTNDNNVLAYGRTQSFGGIACHSSQKGLKCSNRSGHGFFLSKALQQVF